MCSSHHYLRRPPRIFEPGDPRLCALHDRMVVRLQLVLESVSQLVPLGYDGLLSITVQLISGRDSSYVIESYVTREINWPRVRVWEEVHVLPCMELSVCSPSVHVPASLLLHNST